MELRSKSERVCTSRQLFPVGEGLHGGRTQEAGIGKEAESVVSQVLGSQVHVRVRVRMVARDAQVQPVWWC